MEKMITIRLRGNRIRQYRAKMLRALSPYCIDTDDITVLYSISKDIEGYYIVIRYTDNNLMTALRQSLYIFCCVNDIIIISPLTI